eukprot:COSAG01_NODE_1144_length_11530_cov_4.888549_1_plen_67_part_00
MLTGDTAEAVQAVVQVGGGEAPDVAEPAPAPAPTPTPAGKKKKKTDRRYYCCSTGTAVLHVVPYIR